MNEQKINVCRALASIFGEEPSDEETAFVGRCGLDLGLDEGELKLVLQALGTPIDTKAVCETVQDPMMRKFLFRRVVAAILLDADMSETEKAVLDQITETFGWDKAVVDEYVEHMKAFIEMEKKGEEILGRIG